MSSAKNNYGFNTPQRLFVGYTLAVLVDLTVLNFFDEYWEYVNIESFSISFAAAILLQLFLKLALKVEHKVAEYFKSKSGPAAKLYRGVSSYVILVGSKFIMLEIINIMFGEKMQFTGPFNGVVAFLTVVITILAVEGVISKIYFKLSDGEKNNSDTPR